MKRKKQYENETWYEIETQLQQEWLTAFKGINTRSEERNVWEKSFICKSWFLRDEIYWESIFKRQVHTELVTGVVVSPYPHPLSTSPCAPTRGPFLQHHHGNTISGWLLGPVQRRSHSQSEVSTLWLYTRQLARTVPFAWGTQVSGLRSWARSMIKLLVGLAS